MMSYFQYHWFTICGRLSRHITNGNIHSHYFWIIMFFTQVQWFSNAMWCFIWMMIIFNSFQSVIILLCWYLIKSWPTWWWRNNKEILIFPEVIMNNFFAPSMQNIVGTWVDPRQNICQGLHRVVEVDNTYLIFKGIIMPAW